MKVERLNPALGAQISEVDPSLLLSASTGKKIRELLKEHKVIQLKGIPQMTPHDFQTFAQQIYNTIEHPFVSDESLDLRGLAPFRPYKHLSHITGIIHDREHPGNLNEWHADLTWLSNPSRASILRAIEVPPCGGDTVFASMSAAYDLLDPALKHEIEHLEAWHDFTPIYQEAFQSLNLDLRAAQAKFPMCRHPVVVSHPETGEKTLFVNRVSARKLANSGKVNSLDLLEHLYSQVKQPEVQVRFKWETNDILIWDNIATQHYAVSDYWPHRREMQRISFEGIKIS